jgi:hypothetical protein
MKGPQKHHHGGNGLVWRAEREFAAVPDNKRLHPEPCENAGSSGRRPTIGSMRRGRK